MDYDKFDSEEYKIIFNAVKKYQMNSVSVKSETFNKCENILNKIFPKNN
jgi:hypothetical protein